MSADDAFARILMALHEAALDPAQWPVASALIDEACGVQGNGLLIGAGPREHIQTSFVGLYYRGERRTDFERAYLEDYHPRDERVPRVRALPAGHLVHATAVYTTEELRTSATYNEMLHRARMQDGVNVRLDGLDGSHLSWGLADPVTSDGWGSPQLALVKALLPHVRQFVRVQQSLAKAEALDASMSALLNTSRLGVLYLDRRGQILEANDRARAILRHGDGLTDRGGVLRTRRAADQGRLEQVLAAALQASPGVPVSGSLLLHRSPVTAPFVVHVKPVGGHQADFGAQRVAALVLIVEPGRQASLKPALVAEVLGLTRLESRVAVLLAEGQSVREIAAAMERTEDAVYWHLRQIYQKQSLSRQTDLVRLVLSLAEFVGA